MSAVPAKADIASSPRHVCFVPEADIVPLTGARGYVRFFCRQVVVVGAAICRELIVVGDRHGIPPRDRAALMPPDENSTIYPRALLRCSVAHGDHRSHTHPALLPQAVVAGTSVGHLKSARCLQPSQPASTHAEIEAGVAATRSRSRENSSRDALR